VLLRQSTSKEMYYGFTTRYFLYKDGVYHIIRNQSGLLKALQPYKKELRRFISANRLQFRDKSEIFLIRTVSEYEKLSVAL